MFRDAARKLRKGLDQHAIAHMDDCGYHTHSDGDASMLGRWLACSYTESDNELSFWGLNTAEAVELIRTFDAMQMAKKHPWHRRIEVGE